MSSNGESIKINKISIVGENQQQSTNVLTTSSNQTSQEKTKTTKTHYSNDISKQANDHNNQQQQQSQIKFHQQKAESPPKQMVLPDLPMTLGGVSSEVKNSNLTRSVSLLSQQQKLNGISSKSNSPLAPLNPNEFDEYQKPNSNSSSKPAPKIKNPISSNKANLSYMNVSKDQDSIERSNSKSTNKSNYNGKFKFI